MTDDTKPEEDFPDNHILFLAGEINLDVAVGLSQKLIEIDFMSKELGKFSPITLVINSPGGQIEAAWQICDIMDFIECPVYTTGIGQIASAALMIFMNGDRGHRVVSDRTSIMSHRYSWGTSGSHQNLISVHDEFCNTHERIINHYIECTGLTRKVIEDKLLCEHDVWLTGVQAKKYNLVDQVITSKKTRVRRRNTVSKRGKNK